MVGLFQLAERTGLAVIGPLPQGLPSFRVPVVNVDELRALLSRSGRDLASLVRRYERAGPHLRAAGQTPVPSQPGNDRPGRGRRGRRIVPRVRGQRQFVANPRGRISRGPQPAGGRDRRDLDLPVALFAPTLLANLPHAVLAAIVISACLRQIEIREVVRLYRLRPSELVFSIVCLLGVLLIGAVEGIFPRRRFGPLGLRLAGLATIRTRCWGGSTA